MVKAYQQGGFSGLLQSGVQGMIAWGAGEVFGGHLTGMVGIANKGLPYAGWKAAIAGGMGQYGGSTFISGHIAGLSGREILHQTFRSAAIGGWVAAANYGLSDAYKWQTHTKVAKWAESYDKKGGFEYLKGILNIKSNRVVFSEKRKSGYDPNIDLAIVGENALYNNDKFDPSLWYTTIYEEWRHMNLSHTFNNNELYYQLRDAQHYIISNELQNNKYWNFFSYTVRKEWMKVDTPFNAKKAWRFYIIKF
jgi:hypothetical protein